MVGLKYTKVGKGGLAPMQNKNLHNGKNGGTSVINFI